MLYVNFSVKRLKFALKWQISYFQTTLAAIFVTIATVKVKIIGDFYTLAIVLISLQEEIGEKLFSYFSLIGGGGGGVWQKSPLMHVALLYALSHGHYGRLSRLSSHPDD